MAIKMRVLFYSGKAKIKTIANEIKAKYDLAFNAVDHIPPSYSCDKERIVILAITAKGELKDDLRLFLKELTKARASNVALLIDGDEAVANNIKGLLKEAGTNVIDEVKYVNGGLPIIGQGLKDAEKQEIFAWVDRVIANLQ